MTDVYNRNKFTYYQLIIFNLYLEFASFISDCAKTLCLILAFLK